MWGVFIFLIHATRIRIAYIVCMCVWDELNFSVYLYFQLFFFLLFMGLTTLFDIIYGLTVLFNLFFNLFIILSTKNFQFQQKKLFQTDTLSIILYIITTVAIVITSKSFSLFLKNKKIKKNHSHYQCCHYCIFYTYLIY